MHRDAAVAVTRTWSICAKALDIGYSYSLSRELEYCMVLHTIYPVLCTLYQVHCTLNNVWLEYIAAFTGLIGEFISIFQQGTIVPRLVGGSSRQLMADKKAAQNKN